MNEYKFKVRLIPFFTIIISMVILTGCSATRRSRTTATTNNTTINSADIESKVVIKNKVAPRLIDTKNVSREDLVNFAESLIGVKYKYGSMIKENGFDCSGFINYVFNHFKISVPRITVDFTNAGKEIPAKYSKPGDLILFTGSDAQSGIVGHMGIVTENNNGDLKFIHASTSRGVMISGMNSYFLPRFVKINRVFPDF